MSALGGLFGADGGVTDFDDVLSILEPFGLINGHRNARCNSHPTSDMMLAFRKYGVTSLRNFTGKKKSTRKIKQIENEIQIKCEFISNLIFLNAIP